MRRLWKFLIWFNGSIVLAIALSLATSSLVDNTVRQKVLDFIFRSQITPFLIWAATLDVILLLISGISYARKRKRKHREKLLSEFEVLASSKELTPEHMGFESLVPGQELVPGKRPHYPHHVKRYFIPGEKESGQTESSGEYTEDDLVAFIKKKTSFVLLGAPTVGKSRALYNVLKSTPGIMVMKPRLGHLPSHEALRLCNEKLTVILLDDLNEFASGTLDINSLSARLEELNIEWTLVCGCRGGTELSVVKEAASGSIRRLYEQIPKKFTLKTPTSIDKRELLTTTFPARNVSDRQLHSFPTLGNIVMKDALAAMKSRFDQLPIEQRDCLSSMQLLVRGGVLPLTEERVTTVLQTVFNRTTANLRDIIWELDNQEFLNSGVAMPIIPEMAYLGIVTSSLTLEVKDQLHKLVNALKKIDDAEGIFFVGISLGQMGHCEDEILVYDEVVRLFGSAADTALRVQAARALFNKGARLGILGRSNEAIQAFNEVERLFGKASETALRDPVAKALVNKGVTLGQLGQKTEEIEVYDEVVRRFGDSSETALMEQVAGALVNKGVRLGKLGYRTEEIAIYDEVIRRIGNASEIEIALKEQLARALVNKGLALSHLDLSVEAIAVYDEVVDRFGEAEETALRELVGMALFNKGVALGRLGSHKDEIAVYDEVIRRFGDSSEPALTRWVAKALFNKGGRLALLNCEKAAIAVHDEVVRRFGDATEVAFREQVAMALAGKGITLDMIGQSEMAFTALCQAWGMRTGLGAETVTQIEKAFVAIGREPDECP